jgi:hypothetical protein
LSAGPAYLLLDSNQRLLVAGNGSLAPEIALKESSRPRARLSRSRSPLPRQPVLIVPNVFDRQTCLPLIRRWHEEGQIAAVVNGPQTHRISPDLKKRRDHIVRDELSRRSWRR